MLKTRKTDSAFKKMNYWKIISIGFITIILAMFILGAFRAYHYKPSFERTTEEDISLVKSLVSGYFNNRSINYSSDDIVVKDKKIMARDNGRSIVEASIISNNKRDSFMIDLSSKQIIMHEYTETFIPSEGNNSRPFFGRKGFDRR